MHILHVTTFLQGGAGRIITALAVAQRHAGHHVTVVADAGGEPGYDSYPEYTTELPRTGVEFHTVTSMFKRDLPLNVEAVKQLRRLLGGRRVDIAHTHAAMPTMVTRLALAGPVATPVIQTMHGWGVGKTPEQATTDITLLGLADAVVTPSKASAAGLKGLGLSGVPVHVIPYGLEPEVPNQAIDHADAELLTQLRRSGTPLALCIGTINTRKNQALLVRALAADDNVSGIFIGDGNAAPLLQLAGEVGVAERVHVLGYRADASRYLAHADVLVLPSINEGLPIAVLEALRAGVPVVGSAIPEIAEAVTDGKTGVLFEPGHVTALASALRRALEPANHKAMRIEARQAFEANYQADRMLAAYGRLYADVLRRSAS
jgi:glycosyltransferase involved in cell wall biosynthesis